MPKTALAALVTKVMRAPERHRAAAWLRQRTRYRFLALIPLGLVGYARDPELFDSPRFWAEEGSNYFRSALEGRGLAPLTTVSAAPQNPYWHPIPQLATLLAARLARLEAAPAVTTGAWTVVALTVALVVIYGRAALLEGPARRLLALAAPLIAVSNPENWANTLGAHYFCDFALLLLLLEAPHVSRWRRVVSLIVFATLSLLSPTSFLLLPAALALTIRDRTHRAYLSSLGAVVALHVVAALGTPATNLRHPAGPLEAAHLVFSKLVLWPLAGHRLAARYVEVALELDEARFAWLGFGLAAVLLLLLIGFVRASRRDSTTLALSLTYLTAVGGYLLLGLAVGRGLLPLPFGARYVWLPNALMILLLGHQLGASQLSFKKPRTLVFAVLLGASLAVGVSEFRYPPELTFGGHGPRWRDEVRHFRDDPNYRMLRIWPSGWTIEITDRALVRD